MCDADARLYRAIYLYLSVYLVCYLSISRVLALSVPPPTFFLFDIHRKTLWNHTRVYQSDRCSRNSTSTTKKNVVPFSHMTIRMILLVCFVCFEFARFKCDSSLFLRARQGERAKCVFRIENDFFSAFLFYGCDIIVSLSFVCPLHYINRTFFLSKMLLFFFSVYGKLTFKQTKRKKSVYIKAKTFPSCLKCAQYTSKRYVHVACTYFTFLTYLYIFRIKWIIP